MSSFHIKQFVGIFWLLLSQRQFVNLFFLVVIWLIMFLLNTQKLALFIPTLLPTKKIFGEGFFLFYIFFLHFPTISFLSPIFPPFFLLVKSLSLVVDKSICQELAFFSSLYIIIWNGTVRFLTQFLIFMFIHIYII